MLLIPVGLDETRLGRLPFICIAIVVLNVAAFVATSAASGDAEIEQRLRDVVEYWQKRPYLELPQEMGERFHLTRERLADLTRTRVAAAAPGDAVAEQAQLQALCDDLFAAIEDTPERRWALVPARGIAQPGWITHQFLHGSLGHLVGNMLVFFLVVAPFLEDAWGRLFFAAFYLTGGVVAGIAQVIPMGHSSVHVLGASGAISACLGAFALRFAHRRVRMFYWFGLFFRGTFFVPAWLYAFFGLAMDLLGLKLDGTAGHVAYGAHVGGFLFGLAAAVAIRATGLDSRLAPEGAPRWGRTAAASRGSDALAAGRSGDARGHLEDAVARDPSDRASLLALARLHAASFDRAAATSAIERLLRQHFASRDAASVRSLLRELGAVVDPAELHPVVAYRAAEVLGDDDAALAERLDEVAASGGGAVAVKALLRSAERARRVDPTKAVALAEQARDSEDASPELRARADAILRQVAGPPRDDVRPAPDVPPPQDATPPQDEGAPRLDQRTPVRLLHCRLLAASSAGLELVTEEGRRAVLPPALVASLAAGVVAEHVRGGRHLRNAVVLDLLLRRRPGESGRVVLRLLGNDMALAAIHPGVAPRDAFARIVDALVAASGAPTSPSADAAAGRPFTAFRDAIAFEEASWGRRLDG